MCCCCLVTKSRLTLCDPMDCSPKVSSVYGISQARVLESLAISFSRGSSRPRDPTHIYHWATREAHLHHRNEQMLQNRAFLSEPVKDLPVRHWAASHLSVNRELPKYLLITTGVGISYFVGIFLSPLSQQVSLTSGGRVSQVLADGSQAMCPELIRTRGYGQTMNSFTHMHKHTHTHTYILTPGLL